MDLYRSWMEVYEDSIGKFLRIPFIGPTRVSMEKLALSVDAAIKMYGSSLDFYMTMQKPWMDSMEELSRRAAEMLQGEINIETYRKFFDLVIRICEERFTELFRSPGFAYTLAMMLDSSLELRRRLDDLIEDQLKHSPVVTRREIDEVYRELYFLKKRVREQEALLKELTEKIEHVSE